MARDVTVGVEEEFILVDAATLRPAPLIKELIGPASRLTGGAAEKELHRAQIEIAAPPCHSLAELRHQLHSLRSQVATAAAGHGALVLASGSYPGPIGAEGELITEGERYEAIAAGNPRLAAEQLICGCHVHVAVADDEAAVRVLNRLRRYAPYLIALGANSPFWEGADTGFCSYRTEVWSRWPTAGPTGRFAGAGEYWSVLDGLIAAGVIEDRGMAYWDMRPSHHYPTVEIRVSDVAATVEQAVAMAGLARALVVYVLDEGDQVEDFRSEYLRAANWMAARDGFDGHLLDPATGTARPALDALNGLLHDLAPVLDSLGDDDLSDLVLAVASRLGAQRQREEYSQGGLEAVIRSVALESGGS